MHTYEQLIERGHRALNWGADLVTDQGFRGAPAYINGYYKSITAFTTGARLREARIIAQFIDTTFHQNGDFNGYEGDPTAGGLLNYRNAWLARGMHILGRYDIAGATGNLLEAQIGAVNGGVASVPNLPKNERCYCLGNTSSCVLAFLAMGRLEAACSAGQLLVSMVDQQTAGKGTFYLWQNALGDLVKDHAELAGKSVYKIDVGEPEQVYWYLGMAMCAIGSLYLATVDDKWRDAGYKYFELFGNCHEDVYRSITNGKVAWGLGWMYAATKDKAFAQAAQDVWDWHCEIQSDDGSWLRVGQFDSIEEQPLHMTLDTTFERAFYMFEMARTLDV